MDADIQELSIWLSEVDPERLKNLIEDVIDESTFTVFGFLEHYFASTGYTAVWLLGESHLAIHTFPEIGKTYLQVSTCNMPRFLRLCRALALRQRES